MVYVIRKISLLFYQTKLLVTHDMNSIANMADRVIMLDRGKIAQEGKPLEVILVV